MTIHYKAPALDTTSDSIRADRLFEKLGIEEMNLSYFKDSYSFYVDHCLENGDEVDMELEEYLDAKISNEASLKQVINGKPIYEYAGYYYAFAETAILASVKDREERIVNYYD